MTGITAALMFVKLVEMSKKSDFSLPKVRVTKVSSFCLMKQADMPPHND